MATWAEGNSRARPGVRPGMKLPSLVTAFVTVLVTALVTALAATLAGGLLPPSALADAAPAPAGRSVVPGSYLAVVERGPDADYGGIDARSQQLVLISAAGERHVVFTRKVTHHHEFSLMDWSTDGATALLLVPNRRGGELVRLEVATGTTQVLSVPHLLSALLDPAGTGVLATAFKGPRSNAQVLESISWAGAVTRLRSGVSGAMIAGPPGTVLTADSGPRRVQLLLSTADGSVVARFQTPGYCSPVRRWDATRVLETCGNHGDLYLVDPATGAATRLTGGHGRGDYGHLDARYAASNLYVQVAGACGYTYVAKVTRHSTRHLEVPGAVGNVVMVNAVGDDLVLEHAASCDGDRPHAVLSLFDPVDQDETPLVELGRHQDFGRILLLGEVRASTY